MNKDFVYSIFNNREITEQKGLVSGITKNGIFYSKDKEVKVVGQKQYGVKENEEVIITFDIFTCCTIVIKNINIEMLLHIDAVTDVDKIIILFNKLRLDNETKVYFIFGVLATEINVKKLMQYLIQKGISIDTININGRKGNVILENEILTVKSNLGIEKFIPIGNQYIKK